jgi:flagellar hook-associated protein 3 FlgL
MQSQMLLEQMRVGMLHMFNDQQQLASGKRLMAPSDDPAGTARVMDLNAALAGQTQLQKNATFADGFSAVTESALADLRNILNEASGIASQNVGVTSDAQQRASSGAVVGGLIDQMLAIANRQHEGTYIFAGQACRQPAFEQTATGVVYKGDTQSLMVDIGNSRSTAISLTGDEVFGATSAAIRGSDSLMPAAAAANRLSDLLGMNGTGVQRGQIVVDEVGGVGPFTVDLSLAETLGDAVQAINSASTAAGASVTASVGTMGLQLAANPAVTLRVTEQGDGGTASDLGILQFVAFPPPLTGANLEPKVTLTTSVASLHGGLGIDQTGGLMLTNGGKTVTVDLSAATTVQDILRAINGAGVGVQARINADATGIDVISLVSGGELSIGELGGQTATDLGLRSFTGATPLAALNDGAGVATVAGADFRIHVQSGATFDVDIDGALTVADVLNKINAAATAAGVPLTASLVSPGNGIRLVDGSVGAQTLQVEALNRSWAMKDLGLDAGASGATLAGRDVSALHPNGIFRTLEDLRAALQANDTAGITKAGGRLTELLQTASGHQGQAGALGRAVQAHQNQLGDAVVATKAMLSDVQDADYTEVVTRFTQAQTFLQASLTTGSKLMQMSLLDFLQ